jgi:hypothetical protein
MSETPLPLSSRTYNAIGTTGFVEHPATTKSTAHFPRVLSASVLYDVQIYDDDQLTDFPKSCRPFFSFYVDLPIRQGRTEELWMTFGESQNSIVGYVRLQEVATLKTGLTTFKAVDFRAADNPPSFSMTYAEMLQHHRATDYENLVKGLPVRIDFSGEGI